MTADEADALLQELEKQLGAAWAEVFEWLRERNTIEEIAAQLQLGRVNEAIDGLIEAADRFAAATHAAYTDAGARAAEILDEQLPRRLITFDGANERAVAWAERNRYEIRQLVSEDQRAMIRSAVVDGVRLGQNPLDTARDIRDGIGLTDYQQQIVANYRRELQQGEYLNAIGRRLTDGRSDRTVTAAMESGRPLTQAQIDTAVDRYRENWITYRSETIARTESLRVAHQGSDELYRQAIDARQISGGDVEFEWVNGPRTSPEAPRPAHLAMHGQIRTLSQLRAGIFFEDGDGNKLEYPGDPRAPIETTANCRCVRTMRLTV